MASCLRFLKVVFRKRWTLIDEVINKRIAGVTSTVM